jgi:hypothetical protein
MASSSATVEPSGAGSLRARSDNRLLWIERGIVLIAAALYLWLLRTVIPSGDGQVYAYNIGVGALVWNPNHLLMDPAGYGWWHLLSALGLDISPLDALKLIAGVSTLITLVIFDAVLVAAGVSSRVIRLSAVVGLFASRNFLTMAISEEFFMLQMPFLLLALWLIVKMTDDNAVGSTHRAAAIGGCIGLSAAISIHNVFLGMFLAGYFLATGRGVREKLGLLCAFGAAAAAVMVPVFLAGYFFSAADSNFITWMVAYQGTEDNPSNNLYGIVLSAKGIALSLGRLAFNTFANVTSFGALGTVLKSVAFGDPLEMQLNLPQVILGAALLIVTVVGLTLLAYWMLRKLRVEPVVQLGLAWIVAYYAFNFFWDDSSDQFWFQILPPLWLLLALCVSQMHDNPLSTQAARRARMALPVLVGALLILNTNMEVAPKALVDVEELTRRHRNLVQGGDLELIPGRDGFRWIAADASFPAIEQVNLMNAALAPREDPQHISQLAARVERHLAAGGRVIVARVYQRDKEPGPWDNLRKLGWPRERIQQEFSRLQVRELEEIGGVTFHELRLPRDL